MSTESKTEPEQVPLWSCGDPLKYPVPREDGDLWDKLLKPLLERDKQQCDAWRDEVENLLIFAGLFSAVVTAFVVDSYKGLQPDPSQTIIDLLSRIAISLDRPTPGNCTNDAELPMQILEAQHPSSAISRVNALWFISLVISLTTVLVGTVALQWLREHQRYPIQSTPRDKFAIFNMRREGLEDWYVAQIFSALPILLQVSLVLFLVGLIDFLVLIAPLKVFAPIIAFIGLPIIFIVATTIIPSCQWILPPIVFFRLSRRIPSQCPYKSPQSSALTIVLTPILLLVCRMFAFLVGRLNKNMLADTRSLITFWSFKHSTFGYRDSLPADQIALYYRERCCEEQYSRKWLSEAPKHGPEALSAFKFLPLKGSNEAPPIYDWVSGLRFANAESKRRQHVQAACYHCIHELMSIKQDVFNTHEGWCQYIQSVTWIGVPRRKLPIMFSNYYPDDPAALQVIQEEISLGVSHSFHWDARSPETAARIHELYIRLMNYYFTKQAQSSKVELHDATRRYLSDNWYVKSYSELGLVIPPDISEQYTILLERLLLRAPGDGGAEDDVVDAILPPPHVGKFIEIACRSQDHYGQLRTLRLIKTLLHSHFLSDTHTASPQRHLGLFVLMATYVGDIYTRSPYFDPHVALPLIPSGAVTATAADLVLPFSQCMDRIGTGSLQRLQSRDWEVCYGYSAFVDVCRERWRRTAGAPSEGSQTLVLRDTTRRSTSDTALLVTMHYADGGGPEEDESTSHRSSDACDEHGCLCHGSLSHS